MTGSPARLLLVPALRALDFVTVRVAAHEPFAQREGERETGGDDESGGEDPGHGCAPGKRRELIQVSLAPAGRDMGRRCHRPTPLSADRLTNSGWRAPAAAAVGGGVGPSFFSHEDTKARRGRASRRSRFPESRSQDGTTTAPGAAPSCLRVFV